MNSKVIILSLLLVAIVGVSTSAFAVHEVAKDLPMWQFNGAEITDVNNYYSSMVKYDLSYSGNNPLCSISVNMLIEQNSTGIPAWMKEAFMGQYLSIADRTGFNCNTDPTIYTGVSPGDTITIQVELKEENYYETNKIFLGVANFTFNLPPTEPVPPHIEPQPITLSTDKPAYKTGETINISGSLLNNDFSRPLYFNIVSPSGEIVYSSTRINANQDKTFSYQLITGNWNPNGEYTININHRSGNASITFQYTQVIGVNNQN